MQLAYLWRLYRLPFESISVRTPRDAPTVHRRHASVSKAPSPTNPPPSKNGRIQKNICHTTASVRNRVYSTSARLPISLSFCARPIYQRGSNPRSSAHNQWYVPRPSHRIRTGRSRSAYKHTVAVNNGINSHLNSPTPPGTVAFDKANAHQPCAARINLGLPHRVRALAVFFHYREKLQGCEPRAALLGE
jgi:hypothetical protein